MRLTHLTEADLTALGITGARVDHAHGTLTFCFTNREEVWTLRAAGLSGRRRAGALPDRRRLLRAPTEGTAVMITATRRTTTDLTLHCAGPTFVPEAADVRAEHVPILRILASVELTDSEARGGVRGVYRQEGQQLAQAILRHLPAGTVDQLLIALLDHRASQLRVSA